LLRQFRLNFEPAVRIIAGATFVVMLGTIFWRAANRPAQITYQQCATIEADVQRLQCFDTVQRQHWPTNVHQMSFGQLLMSGRSRDSRSIAPE
jgi:hypothetical protein